MRGDKTLGYIPGANKGEDDHKELQQRHGHDHKVDCCGVYLLIDLTGGIDVGKVMPIN